jgi:hypothetical protein
VGIIPFEDNSTKFAKYSAVEHNAGVFKVLEANSLEANILEMLINKETSLAPPTDAVHHLLATRYLNGHEDFRTILSDFSDLDEEDFEDYQSEDEGDED